MGLFDFLNKRFNSKDTFKRNILSVYKRKYKRLDGSGQHLKVIHGYALAETLMSWCQYNGELYDNERIMNEIIPFTMMEQEISLDVFCEYLLYRTEIEDYDYELLRDKFNELIKDCLRNNPEYISKLRSQSNLYFAWHDLIDRDLRGKVFHS